MRRKGEVRFKNAILPLIEYLKAKTGHEVILGGISPKPKEEEAFIALHQISSERDTQLSRRAEFLVYLYTPFKDGLDKSIEDADILRSAIDNAFFEIETVQVSTCLNGAILTDSDYPSFYAQELNADFLFTATEKI